MEQIKLEAAPRTVTGKKVQQLRAQGLIPAVLYGPSVGSRSLQIDAGEAERAIRQGGASQLITLRIAGDDTPVQTLVRDMQRDPIRRHLMHIDLYQVDMTKTLTVEVPLILVGESPTVTQNIGILLQGLQSVEVECLPGDLLEAIEIDLTQLTEIGQQITIGDLAIPSTVRVLSDPDEMVVHISSQGEGEPEEEEEMFPEEEGVAEPELVGREEEVEEE